jgi:tetratricopeptide (TPR) repeat protein
MDLLKLGTRPVDPYPFTSRAYILETIGADEAALKEAKEALRVSADFGPAYNMLGRIYDKRKDFKKAFENYRLAAMYGNDRQARLGLAQSYEHLKYYNEAVSQYQRLIDASSKDTEGFFGMARSYAEMSQDSKALEMLARAQKMGLEDKVDVKRIHDIINNRKMKVGGGKNLLQQKKKVK